MIGIGLELDDSRSVYFWTRHDKAAVLDFLDRHEVGVDRIPRSASLAWPLRPHR